MSEERSKSPSARSSVASSPTRNEPAGTRAPAALAVDPVERERRGFRDRCVDRHEIARGNEQHVAGAERRAAHGLRAAVAYHPREQALVSVTREERESVLLDDTLLHEAPH